MTINDEFDKLKKDIKYNSVGSYLDADDYSDETDENLEGARNRFVHVANEYFKINGYNFIAKDMDQAVYIYNKNTMERIW